MKKFILLLNGLFIIGNLSTAEIKQAKKVNDKHEVKTMTKTVLMIIAKTDFRDEEYFEPKEIFLKSGIKVVTASSSLGEAKGMLGGKVKVDTTIDKINVSDYDGIIFVGGSGAVEYWENGLAHKIAQEAINQNKVLAAICIAPVTLAKSGVLKNKKATVFPSANKEIISFGANYTKKDVEIDGKIVTGSGPQAAKQFGEKIKELLLNKI
jgi:protease I